MSSENISDLRAKVSRKSIRKRVATLRKLEKPAREVGGGTADCWCPSFELWKGGTRFLRIVLEVFARRTPSLPDDNLNKLHTLRHARRAAPELLRKH